MKFHKQITLKTQEILILRFHLKKYGHRANLGNRGRSLHQHITNRWAEFFMNNPQNTTTLQDILNFVKEIDDEFGHLFVPPIR